MTMDDHMQFTLYIICIMAVTVMVIAVCFTVVGKAGFDKVEDATTALNSFITGTSVQFSTVVIIVVAVFVMRVNNLLDSEGTLSILSGIAGYVLGGVAHSRGSEKSQN
jgi:hypothetical protein